MQPNNADKLRERGFFTMVLKNLQTSFQSLFETLDKKVFRVRLENEKYLINQFQKVADSITNRKVGVGDGAMEFQKVSALNINAEQLASLAVEKLENLNVEGYSQEEITSRLDEIKNVVTRLQSVETAIKEVSSAVTKSGSKDIKFPEFPKKVSVDGTVEVSNFTEVNSRLDRIAAAVGSIRMPDVNIPQQKDIVFPKKFEISNLDGLKKEIQSLQEAIKNIPVQEYPETINIGNFPVQKIPQPVTNFNINPITGILKTTAVTVGNAPTKLPETPVSKRRHIQIYNNSDDTILYIGGADVNVTNGIPIDVKSFSQGIDAASGMDIYGIVAANTIEVRVLEITNNTAGP